ncbi:MAG TPA: NAD-dependent epimerase/dehydratase family protein [Puia sp.]|jgi:dihydroflavonol-4-reductase|nr:NAD-dependent epimerase/dehydratase family protein [Puia sp.]
MSNLHPTVNSIDDATAAAIEPGAKVLVTGGTGFLGTYIIGELVRSGYAVRAIHRQGAIPFSLPASIGEQVEWLHCDVRDPLGLEDAMAGMDAVIHAAAKISFSAQERRELWSTNIEGTANVVNAALERNIRRFLYVSSVAALGRTASSEEVTEEKSWEKSPYNTNYAISKFHGEMEVWRGMGEGLPAVIVNPSTILGYGDWNNTSCAIFRSVYNEFPWYTEGINGFVDVQDTARAIVRLLQTDIHGERYILNGDNWSWRHLFETMAKEFGKKPPTREATPLLAGIAWRAEKVKSLFTGRRTLLTRESARVAASSTCFSSGKFLRLLPDFRFTPLEETIRTACQHYLRTAQA